MSSERLVLSDLHPELTLAFDRWQEKVGNLTAEVRIETSSSLYKPLLLEGRLNLLSVPTRQGWAKRLEAICPEWEWNTIIENACQKAIRHYRQGTPAVTLSPELETDGITWHAYPLLHTGHPCILFGTGGLGKSYFALYLAMLIESGYSHQGFQVEQGRVLYLDWESDLPDLCRRSRQIWYGHHEVAEARPIYRKMTQRLADDVQAVSAIIQEQGVSIVIVDSLAAACGGDLFDAQVAIKVFTALRSLGTTALVIGHTPHEQQGQNPHLYGSVFFGNLARSVWEMKKVQEVGDNTSRIGLFHRKSNLGKLQKPMGFSMTISEDETSCQFHRIDILEDPGFASAMPAKARIQRALAYGPKTAKDLAVDLGIDLQYVRNCLSAGKGRWCLLMDKDQWGLLQATQTPTDH